MALSKIKTNSIADNAITSTKIGVDVIVAEDLASNSITVAEIASNAVTTAKIADANVTTDKLATTLTVTHALGSASTPSITFTGDTNTGIFSPAADTIAFAEGGTEAMRIDSSGNVGIGTSSPLNKFTVLADGSVNTSGDAIDVGSSIIGSNRNFSTPSNPALFNINSNSTLGADVGGTLGFGGRYTSTSQAMFAIIKGAKENATDGNYSTYLAFGTRASGSDITERMRIDSSGNVGIGTASPNAGSKLTLTGTSTTASMLITSSTSATNVGVIGTYSAWQGSGTNDDLTIATYGTKNLILGTNATEQMRIDSAGLLKFNSGYGSAATAYGCRAWVNFNGTGTVAIRASGNVSSITDNATGDYTVNFTTAMPDVNYSSAMTCSGAANSSIQNPYDITTNLVGSIRVQCRNLSNAAQDPNYFSVTIFR